MKRILIVTESFDVGGLETYIQGQVRVLLSEGCEIYLVAGSLGEQAQLPDGVTAVYSGFELSGNMSVSAYLNSVSKLQDIVREHGIDCIHAHPFGSFIVAQTVAEKENIALVLTLHGPASMHNYGSSVEHFLLRSVILPHADLVLAVSPETQGLAIGFVQPERLLMQPNVVSKVNDPVDWVSGTSDNGWLVVSRLDRAKIVGIEDFIKKAVAAGIQRIRVVGDGEGRALLAEKFDAEQIGQYVEFLGVRHDTEALMRDSGGVAGMGRVLLEGISLGVPVVLLGYDGVKGCVDEVLFKRAAYANFSGRSLPSINADQFKQQLASYLPQFKSPQSTAMAAEYEEGAVWRSFYQRLNSIHPERSNILSRCYKELQVADVQSEQALYDSDLLFDCLASLIMAPYRTEQIAALQPAFEYAFSRRSQERLQRLHQSHLRIEEEVQHLKEEWRQSHSQDAAERLVDEQLAMSRRQVDHLQADIQALKNSTSWSLTRPLRVLARLLRDPGKFSADVQNYLLWKRGGQQSETVVARPDGSASTHDASDRLDFSWSQFELNVLAFRDQYKGVFVQSVVIDWHVPLYQRPQHMAKALGRLGYLVLYETDCWTTDHVNGVRHLGDNVWLVNAQQSKHLKGVLRSFYSTAVVNEYGPHMLEGNAVVYEYIDHIDPAISGDNVAALTQLKDKAFGGDANYIVASSRALESESLEAFRGGADKVVFIPNGVDCRHYRRDWGHVALPEQYTQFLGRYKRIVGYFGALAPWLWYEVMAELAQRMPDYGFVYIGPDYYGGSEKLPKTDNVLWLGPIDYAQLPAYAKRFDIAIIPFEPGEIARTTSPLKLFEYFALEVPVVVTSAMDECTCYPEVFAAGSADEYVSQIERAFEVKDDPAYRERMRQLADENDWIARARKLEPLFPK